MRVLLIGNSKSYENNRIAEEIKLKNGKFDFLAISNLVLEVKNNKTIFNTNNNINLIDYDIYLFRGVGEALWEIMLLAQFLKKIGKVIIEEKLATKRYVLTKFPYTFAENEIPVIDTKIIFALSKIEEDNLHFPLILKSTIGSRGRSVFKINSIEEFRNIYKAIGPKVIIQPYLPIKFDYRVFIVGEKVLGIMKRYNSDFNFLTNISAGGKAEVANLPLETLELCLRAKQLMETEICGVDVIEYEGEYYILEVNNSPQFQGFERCSGVNVAEEIVQYMNTKFEDKTNRIKA